MSLKSPVTSSKRYKHHHECHRQQYDSLHLLSLFFIDVIDGGLSSWQTFCHPTFYPVFLPPLDQVFPVEVWIVVALPVVVAVSAAVEPPGIAVSIAAVGPLEIAAAIAAVGPLGIAVLPGILVGPL